jgi:hypothetical protein
MLRKFIMLTVLGASLGLGVNISAGQAAPLSPTPMAAESEMVQVNHRRHHHHYVPHVRIMPRHHHHHR